jgi:hypothetical protein
LRTAIELLPAQREFVRKSADLALDLNPAIINLRRALPDLNAAVEAGTPVLDDQPEINRRLREALRELNQLVQQPETATTLLRLADTFETATPLARYVAPAQTVCNYWNYWFTYFPNALSDEEPLLGNAFRQTLTRYPAAQFVEAPLGGYSGIGANGKSGPADGGDAGVYKPYQNPTVNSRTYQPTGQDGSDCQNGQIGYALGDLPVPGQVESDPAIRVSDFPGSRGPTTLFWNAAKERELVDTRVPGRQPATWEGNGP